MDYIKLFLYITMSPIFAFLLMMFIVEVVVNICEKNVRLV